MTTSEQQPWPDELREIVAKEVWTAYRRLGVVDWPDGPVAFADQSPVTRNHFAVLADAILAAIAASPYRIVDTRESVVIEAQPDDWRYAIKVVCHAFLPDWELRNIDRMVAALMEATGDEGHRDDQPGAMGAVAGCGCRARWERLRDAAADLADMQSAGRLVGLSSDEVARMVQPGDLDDIPADPEPSVEAMIDELPRVPGQFRVERASDWRAALREAYEQVRSAS